MTELDVAREAARAAAKILANYRFSRPTAINSKSAANDLVTEVDGACEAAIRDVFQKHTPDIHVLGEEGGGDSAAPTRWVVDPIDGTTNFVHGFPYYAVSIGLQVDGIAEVGLVLSATGEEYSAARGKGTFSNERRLRVSDCRTLDAALLGTGFPYVARPDHERILAIWRSMLLKTHGIRRPGAASLDLAQVAAGAFDGFWEFHLGPWDVAGGRLLVEEAGGRVSAIGGGPLADTDVSILASNGWLHDQIQAVIDEP